MAGVSAGRKIAAEKWPILGTAEMAFRHKSLIFLPNFSASLLLEHSKYE
jgi:hypothetical protein